MFELLNLRLFLLKDFGTTEFDQTTRPPTNPLPISGRNMTIGEHAITFFYRTKYYIKEYCLIFKPMFVPANFTTVCQTAILVMLNICFI